MKLDLNIEKDGEEELPGDLLDVVDPDSFVNPLTFRKVSGSFVDACASVISTLSGNPSILAGRESVRVLAMELDDGRLRLLVKNDYLYYSRPLLDVGWPIKAIKVLTRFPLTRLEPDGSRFSVKVPGKGAVILDVTLAG